MSEYTVEITQNDNVVGGVFAGKVEGIVDLSCPNSNSSVTIIEDQPFRFEFKLIIKQL